MQKSKSITRSVQVNIEHKKLDSVLGSRRLEQLLENGRKLRKSKVYPIKCRLRLNRVWKMSNAQRETILRNTGSLPIDPYQHHWHPYDAIIPDEGIARSGYVKIVWVKAVIESIKIDNQDFALIDPYVHDTEQWIQGFMLDSTNLIRLLPSPKIEVKYFQRTT